MSSQTDAPTRASAPSFATALLVTTALSIAALLANRLALPATYKLPDGGRSFIVIPVPYLLAVLAGLIAWVSDPGPWRRVMRTRWGWVAAACLAADAAVFAYAGWVERSFKVTAMLTLPSLASLGALVAGAYLWKWRPRMLDGLVAVTVTLSAIAGVLQITERAGLSTPPGRLMASWDAHAAEILRATIHYPRAQGFELNPNVYAPFAAIGLIWALFAMKPGWVRGTILASSMVIVVLSQSRTVLLVVLAVVVLAVARGVRTGTFGAGGKARMFRGLALIALTAAGLLFMRYGPITIAENGGGVVEQHAEIVEPNSTLDPSMAGRVEAWKSASRAIAANPWGYLQDYPKYSTPLSHPHNEVLFRLLYAGPPWLAVHLIFLAWLLFWLHPPKHRWFGPVVAVALIVNGITEPLFKMSPYTVLLYALIGAMAWETAAGSSTEPDTAVS